MGFPCPMCMHNPKRYEKVHGSCISNEGSSLVTIVIQHLIHDHLHSCRICGEPLVKAAKDKSVVRYRAILAAHGNCSKKKWPEENDIFKPELLSEEQQAVVLAWDRRKAAAKCTSRTKDTSEEEALYKDLYMDLHGKPLMEGGATWTYMVPGHKQEELVKAEVAKVLKRKYSEVEKELEKLKEAQAACRQALLFSQDGQSLAFLNSLGDTELARRTPLELPGDLPQFVNPKHLMLDRYGNSERTKELLKKDLEQTLLGNFTMERDLSDSGYSSKNTDR